MHKNVIVEILRWLLLLGLFFWYIVYWTGGRKVVEDIQKSMRLKDSNLDTILMVAILICSLVLTGIAILITIGVLQTEIQNNSIFAIGGFLFTYTGILGMFYCRHHLGRFWTSETSLQDGHKVVDNGPYGIVRHPIYSFAILMYVGLALAFPSWLGMISVILITLAYGIKAWDEDEYLARSLSGYQAYQGVVPYRLVPGLW